jgi:hypothetical protein
MIPSPVPLALNYGMARASVASGGSLVNLYAQSAPVGAKDDVVLIGVPGTAVFAQLNRLVEGEPAADTNVNAMIAAFNKIVVVTDNASYLVAQDGTWTRFNTGLSGAVQVAWNRNDVAAVNGATGLWINQAECVAISDPDFYLADDVTFIDGYLVFNRAGTGQAFHTGRYSRTIAGLDFAEAEQAPDATKAVMASGDNLFLLGEDTTEVWYNAANPVGFTFSRIQGATMGHGVASAATVAEDDGRVFWLTSGGLVVMAAGPASVARISDDQVEAALKDRRDDWGGARAYVYADEGHLFYDLTVGDLTLSYDDATGFWHQRANYSRGCAIGRCYVQAWGKHFVGDDQGRILELSGAVYDDAGEPLVAEVVTMPYTNNRLFSAIGSLEIEMDTGLSPLGGEYHVLLSASSDGVVWDADRPMSAGKTGERGKIVEWRKLGARKTHRFRLRISDPFRRALLAKAHVRLG